MKNIFLLSLNSRPKETEPTALKCYYAVECENRTNLVRRKNIDDSDICLGQEEKYCEDVTKRGVNQNHSPGPWQGPLVTPL